ncbi:E3 ubiquitin-protein ligase TRIM56-like isoform X1 [Branchiostoma floridae]|uniref:E3 ubiquitin-protein ligase TRIM56-like isoform X1 n=1 Tax=Branchiostoma floridae TaxID=7739 RepID=A0A9J7HDT7_BRAFL|nr:E3 ubiquitin-protein ligase TRIM56-like isoform X1 [Branchiostoma floridae]
MGQENSTPSHPAALASSCTSPSVFTVRPISQFARRRGSRRRARPPQTVPAEECARLDHDMDGARPFFSQEISDTDLNSSFDSWEAGGGALEPNPGADGRQAELGQAAQWCRTSMTEKEEFSFVTCRLCQGLLNVPKLLSCWHPFCLPCLTDYKNSQTEQGSNVIACPICQETTPLPSDGIGGLRHKANVFLSRVADLSSFIETYHNTIFMKHYCTQQARFTPSNRTCKQCKDFLCQECSIYHLLQHTSATRTCRRHNLPTNAFCESCNIVVCSMCAQAAHIQHVTSDVDRASESYRDILGQLVEKCKDLKWPLEESLEKNIQETRFQIQNSTEALVSHVTQFIRKKEQFLLSQLEQFSTEMKDRVELEKEKYVPLAEQCKPMCELGDRLVRFGSNHELLSVQQEMTRRLTEASIEQTPQDISSSLQERIKFIPNQLPNLDSLLPLNVIGTTGTYTEPVSTVEAASTSACLQEEAGPSTEPDGTEDMSAGHLTEPVAENVTFKEEEVQFTSTPEDLPESGKRKRKTGNTEETTTEEGAVAKKPKVVESGDDPQEESDEEDDNITPAGSTEGVVEKECTGNQEDAPRSQEVAESAEEASQTSEEALETWEDASEGSQEHDPVQVKEEVEEHTAEEAEKGEEGEVEKDEDNIATRVRGRKKGWLKWW